MKKRGSEDKREGWREGVTVGKRKDRGERGKK